MRAVKISIIVLGSALSSTVAFFVWYFMRLAQRQPRFVLEGLSVVKSPPTPSPLIPGLVVGTVCGLLVAFALRFVGGSNRRQYALAAAVGWSLPWMIVALQQLSRLIDGPFSAEVWLLVIDAPELLAATVALLLPALVALWLGVRTPAEADVLGT